jgi:hypothetical protein
LEHGHVFWLAGALRRMEGVVVPDLRKHISASSDKFCSRVGSFTPGAIQRLLILQLQRQHRSSLVRFSK